MEQGREAMFDGWFPLEFDPAYYRQSYPELKDIPDEYATEHYRRYAGAQGRTACEYDRSEYLRTYLREHYQDAKILEIGPFDNPFCIGPKVKYFDVMDAEHLRERSVKLNRPYHDVPERIDYVSETADLSIVSEQFDIVFSSHVIEHQADLVRHLQIVESLLNPNGLYIMCVPDKRYCFDHFIDAARPSEILGAYFAHRTLHPLQKVIEDYAMTTHSDPIRHWLGDHGKGEVKRENVLAALKEFGEKPEEYIDVHESQYTPESFERIIRTLNEVGLTGLSVYRLSHTVWGRFEFCAVLKRRESPAFARKFTEEGRTLRGLYELGTIEADKLEYTKEIDGMLDEYAASPEQGTLRLRGWSVYHHPGSNQRRMIVLKCNKTFYAFDANDTARPDIADHFHDDGLLRSGFLVYAGTDRLEKCREMIVHAAYRNGDRWVMKAIGKLDGTGNG